MKSIKSERGQSLVELAISIVILIYLLAGAVEFGLAFFQFVQLRDAAQEGALFGSISMSSSSPTTTDYSNIEARVRGAASSPVNLADVATVKVSIYVDATKVWENGSSQGSTSLACESHELKVEVSYDHKIFMPFIPGFIGSNTIPLNATVTDTILSPLCP